MVWQEFILLADIKKDQPLNELEAGIHF